MRVDATTKFITFPMVYGRVNTIAFAQTPRAFNGTLVASFHNQLPRGHKG